MDGASPPVVCLPEITFFWERLERGKESAYSKTGEAEKAEKAEEENEGEGLWKWKGDF